MTMLLQQYERDLILSLYRQGLPVESIASKTGKDERTVAFILQNSSLRRYFELQSRLKTKS